MPDFAYKALDRTGKSVAGVVSAADRAAAVALLGERDTFVTDMEESAGRAKRRGASPASRDSAEDQGASIRWNARKVSPRQRLTLLRQLSVGLSAGLTLVNALEVVADQADSPAVKALVADLIERVTSGDSLSDAEASHPEAFSTMQVSMTRAGEAAGALDTVMTSLTAFAERDLELREKLRSAAIYPLMVLGLGFISILVIMLFILPRIMTVVGESGSDLPLPTVILMGMTDWVRSPMGIGAMVIMAVALGLWWRWSRTPDGVLAMDRFKLKLPFIGTAIRRVSVSRFARTLGTLAAANIPIVESMRIVRDTLGNEALARDIDTAADGIVRGSSIADELRDTGQFPSLLIQVIAMGERTGRLDELLMDTADTYDKETNAALQRVMTIVPVLFILVLAVFVAFILAAALLPIMGMDLGEAP
ncbi:type II secretion system F family protein [Algisphaera agarilytica]|uniref:Type II secretory pathway component PulF n=1 Tax=Algisphaera agarilytica TaxID=1385975 RepID=A0A7X0H5X2_9BACT|nr:type II secretion system F family protein [Algisphaera agarilytica]MBB6429893.1 type II secretory pathway component PulF [Algisphaera agarilytica]